jgi:hypothetical protein
MEEIFKSTLLTKFFFFVGLGFALRVHTRKAGNCKAGTLTLEPHLYSILLWLLWRWGLMNYLLDLALNQDPPNVSLPNS